MSINYKDIIDRMERRGNYSSASEYRDTLLEHHHSEHERADRFNPADGAQHSHTGDLAEEAYNSLRRDERRAEERREEQMREEMEERAAYQRQQESEEQGA